MKLFYRAKNFDWPVSLISVAAASVGDCRPSLRAGMVGASRNSTTRQNTTILPEMIVDGRILVNGTGTSGSMGGIFE